VVFQLKAVKAAAGVVQGRHRICSCRRYRCVSRRTRLAYTLHPTHWQV
jgi:hypothetical protein